MITCGFVGLGLIGGSIARALKANRKDIVIIACDPNEETLKLATEQKIADEAYPAPCDAFTACDYIFLCAPVSHNDENLLKILSYRKKDCILTDVGSVKTPINSLIHSLGLTDCFIGGHPMAGSERIGFANSKAGLLENAYYILAPAPQVPAAKIAEFQGAAPYYGIIDMRYLKSLTNQRRDRLVERLLLERFAAAFCKTPFSVYNFPPFFQTAVRGIVGRTEIKSICFIAVPEQNVTDVVGKRVVKKVDSFPFHIAFIGLYPVLIR